MVNEDEVSMFQSFFRAVEENKQDVKLERLLDHTVKKVVKITDTQYVLVFNNGVAVGVLFTFDGYHLYISNPTLYFNNENSGTKLTGDRVAFYLQQIGNWKYE